MNLPQPILVLGAARSGTTLLGNLLALHPQVASLQHPLHWGQKENNICALARTHPDFSADDEFIVFVETFTSADLFRLSELPDDFFYTHGARPADVFAAFVTMMNAICSRSAKSAWLTKYDPPLLCYPALRRRFQQELEAQCSRPVWVHVKRDPVDVSESYINMEGDNSKWKLGYIASRWGILLQLARMAQIERFAKDLKRLGQTVVEIDFADLAGEGEAAVAAVLAEAGLELPDGRRHDPARLPRNASARRTSAPLGPGERRIVGLLHRALQSAPGARLAGLIVRLRERTRGSAKPHSWRLLKNRYMPGAFMRHLEQTGQTELLKTLKYYRTSSDRS